ncbi:hypothetical protein Barb4_01505 [Bacteroidales bacterium Barb4]|nr:hypothetical protein Barb4_01505 [Bacteroidales bacterium Barb4]
MALSGLYWIVSVKTPHSASLHVGLKSTVPLGRPRNKSHRIASRPAGQNGADGQFQGGEAAGDGGAGTVQEIRRLRNAAVLLFRQSTIQWRLRL